MSCRRLKITKDSVDQLMARVHLQDQAGLEEDAATESPQGEEPVKDEVWWRSGSGVCRCTGGVGLALLRTSDVGGGGGVGGGVRNPKICAPKMARPDFPNSKFHFFPRCSLWSGGGILEEGSPLFGFGGPKLPKGPHDPEKPTGTPILCVCLYGELEAGSWLNVFANPPQFCVLHTMPQYHTPSSYLHIITPSCILHIIRIPLCPCSTSNPTLFLAHHTPPLHPYLIPPTRWISSLAFLPEI